MKIRCMNCMKEYEENEGRCPECGFVPGTPPKEANQLEPGARLADRYIVGMSVSYGGFGIIYRAWDDKLQVMVAIKEYFPANCVYRNPGEKNVFAYSGKKEGEFRIGLATFLDEARNTAKFISNPNIVNVFDYFEENGTAYMVMEFMEGETLKQYTKRMGGRLPWEKAVEIIAQICDDLSAVHKEGILHRDISPDNIMLLSDGKVKLFDFGAARFSNLDKEEKRTVILKRGFAPQEQYVEKSKQGPWTDVYAIGATLYRSITGVLPDESTNRIEAVRRENKDTLIPPKQIVRDVPDYIDQAICRAMALEPTLRFKDVAQFKQALLNKRHFADVEKELKKRKSRRAVIIGGIILAAAGGIFGCISYYQSRKAQSTLKGAEVSVWVSVKENQTQEEAGTEMESLLEEFYSAYPEVSVNVSYIPEAEYGDKLQAAVSDGSFPTLYENAPEELLNARGADLSEVFTLVNRDDYYCMNPELLGQSGDKRLPLGMHTPVVYKNTLLEAQAAPSNDRDSFLAGNSWFMVGDCEDYGTVQDALPGIYSMYELPEETMVLKYDHVWSVDSEASKLDQTAARRILSYFLSENAQDVLYLQNQGAFPLNKSEMAAYLEIYPEFDFVSGLLDGGKFQVFWDDASYQEKMDSCYETLRDDGDFLKILTEGAN